MSPPAVDPAATDSHEEEEYKLGEEGPVGNISVTKSSCRNDIGYLEESHLKTLRDTLIKVKGVEGNQTGRH